jgi:zinc transport system ATP-binding protein
MADILTVRNLRFAYEKIAILSDVNIAVQEGEFIGVIGPNGGGKTTLLKLLTGFLEPEEGEIRLFGEKPQQNKTLIGYVPQALRFDRLFPITVLELVLGGQVARTPWLGWFQQRHKKAALEALERVGLSSFKDAPFSSLSGGQAQRALIARALCSNPKILLLDEPTASVDTRAAADIHGFLSTLKGQITILMVTHDISSIIQQVDRVICVQNQVTSLRPEQVCEHFALGLYHAPLISSDQFGAP